MRTRHRAARGLVALAVLGGLLAAPLAALARADSLEDQLRQTQQKQEQLAQEAKQVRGQLGVLEDQVDAASRAWSRAQAEHEAAWAEYLRLLALKEQAEIDLQTTEAELKKITAELQAKQRRLAARVRSLYVDSRVEYLDVLFGATSFSDFLSRFDLLQAVVRHDSQLVNTVKIARAAVEIKKLQVSQRRDELATVTQQAAQKNNQAAIKKGEVEQQRKNLDGKRQELRAAMDALDRESTRLEGVIVELEKAIARQRNGFALDFPVRPVQVTDPYGMRWHPILQGERRMHWGTDFAAKMNQPVFAAESGTVILSGPNGVYGNTVIISHGIVKGKTISTLYAHNTSLLVAAGAKVERGQQIARAGTTGWSTGPHVHFEVRVDGKAVEPMDYLPTP